MSSFDEPGQPDQPVSRAVLAELASLLPEVAERCVAAIVQEVPGYAHALTGVMGEQIERAVQQSLAGFLRMAATTGGEDASTPMQPALDGAYALGQGEARGGRTMDALLAAYRVGARVAWRELSGAAVATGLDAGALARFAELVFAYIDGLSAASVSGHAEELATEGRFRERRRERLAAAVLAARDAGTLRALAERADWPEPQTLTCVVLPNDRIGALLAQLSPQTLLVTDEASGPDTTAQAVLLVPDAEGPGRFYLLRALRDRPATVGPARPWAAAAASYRRALRAAALASGRRQPVDTEEHLAALVIGADPHALADLRQRALEPLRQIRPATAERLAETLRSWLLLQGRRDEVAAELHVHAQTVRYRMAQVRELFGDRLTDPAAVLELVLALQPDDGIGQGLVEATG